MAKVVPLVAAGAGVLATGGLGAALLPWGSLGGLTTGLAGAGLGFSLSGAAAVLGTLGGFVVSTAVNALGSAAFTKKPSRPDFAQAAQGISTMVASGIETHKIVYGRMRVAGPFGAMTTDSGPDRLGNTQTGTNKFLHLIVILAGHEVEEIGDIYLGDRLVALDEDGWATDAPYSRQVETTATRSATITTLVVTGYSMRTGTPRSLVTVTTAAAHGFSAGERVAIRGTTNVDLEGNRRILAVPSSTTFTYESRVPNTTATGGSVGAEVVTTGTVSLVRVRKHLGAADQAADPAFVAECGLSEDYRFRGCAYLYVRLEYNPDAFPQGIPNVSAVVKGKKVYDPRSLTAAWSANVALCVRDYLTADYGFACGSDEINDTFFSAAANVCDEDVTLSTGGTQDRYACNGVVDTSHNRIDNLNALVAAMAGSVTYVQGKFRAHAGAYDLPAGALTTAMLAGPPVTIRARTPRQDLFNAVRGTYVDPAKNWQPTDFPPVTNATYEAQDGGERLERDLVLTFTDHPEAAQRIAKIILEQGRQGIQVELPLNHAALPYAVFDTVTYTDADLGWTDKVFRIRKLSTPGIGPITLSLQEESAAVYDWNDGEATVIDPAPDTNLPDPFVVRPPGAITVEEELYVTRSGDGVKVQANLAWGASSDAFLRSYQPEYKSRSESAWSRLTPTPGLTASVEDIAPGEYDFRVKALNALGVSSEYSTASAAISGLLAPPTEPQNLTISTIGGHAILRWDQSPDLDVRIGGNVLIRHAPDTTATWVRSTSIGNAMPGTTTAAVLPLKPGIYLAKARDSSGIESTNAASVTTAQATALTYANVTSLTEHPAFSGSKTACFLDDDGLLTIAGEGLFDDIPDLDAVPDLDAYGGVAEAGTYLFSGGIDLGSVMPVRLTSHLKAEVINVLDTIDARAANIDDWTSFDGDVTGDADALVSVRQTNDDPAGTPTWGAWNRLDSGENNARAFQFKLGLTSADPAYNILISELSVTVDEVA